MALSFIPFAFPGAPGVRCAFQTRDWGVSEGPYGDVYKRQVRASLHMCSRQSAKRDSGNSLGVPNGVNVEPPSPMSATPGASSRTHKWVRCV